MNLFSILFWTVSLSGYWANPANIPYPASQIGVPKNVFVGKLECAARLTDLEHLQTWCIKGGKVVWNQIADLSNMQVITTDYEDNKTGEVNASIAWLVAYVSGNPQTVGYQVTYKVGFGLDQMMSGQF